MCQADFYKLEEDIVWSGGIWKLEKFIVDCCDSSWGMYVCVQAVNVYGEKVSMIGNCHGSNLMYEVVCVLDVTGVSGGERVDEVIDKN